MSRIGKLPISIPAGVTVSVNDENVVSVKGPKGEMSQAVHPSIKVEIVDSEIVFTIDEQNDSVEMKQKQAFHGLYRSLVHNMVVGVSEGYVKKLELVGVGFRASNQGNLIEFALGYTHKIKYLEDKEVFMATIKVKQIKSRIGAPKDQKRTLDTLGLRKINQVVEVEDTPSTRGMVQKLHHLVIVVD